jgi:predicted metal-binding protein
MGKKRSYPLGTVLDEKANKENLERYRHMAIELGAEDAKIVEAKSIKVDERVRLKCLIPRCSRAGETPNCPPYAPDLDLVRRAFERYSMAILIKCEVPISKSTREEKERNVPKEAMLFHKKGAEVVSAIERQAFKDGYSLAMGLAGGSCKDYLCKGEPCQYLEIGKCRFPLQSRPSIEAMGINITELLNEAGWATYALLDDLQKMPKAITVGLVFIY